MIDLGFVVVVVIVLAGIAYTVGARRTATRLLLAGFCLAVLLPFAILVWRSL